MSTIKSSTTTTTAYSVSADTTGTLVIQTGSTPTTAVTVGTDQSVTFAQAANLPNTFGFKNRIINGAMVIDQRNAGASVTPANAQYLVDRWYYGATQASKFTAEQTITGVSAPVGFTDYLALTVSSAVSVGAGDVFYLSQVIEGFNCADFAWGSASAATVTLSFWVRSSLTGTFGGSLQNSAANRSYPFSYTISAANTWEQKSVTIAGDTSGTWLTTNGKGIQLNFGLGSGATYSGTAGAWAGTNYITATGATSVVGTNGATFYITGVQLEKGSTATSFDYRPYGTELALCQRYFETVGCGGVGIARNGTAPGATMSFKFQVAKRTTSPTVSINVATDIYAPAIAAYSATSWSGTNFSSNAGITGDVNTATTTAALGTSVQWYGNDNILISAEL